MSKYKVGDKFIVEIQSLYNREFPPSTTQLYKLDGFCNALVDEDELDKLQKINPKLKIEDIDDMLAEHDLKKEAYEKGLTDAWELARKLVLSVSDGGISIKDFEIIFGAGLDYKDILKIMTPQEAFAKIEAYEVSQQIQVGDVVYIDQVANAELEDDSEAYGVVTGIYDDSDHYEVLMRNGDGVSFGKRQMEKTGRHIDISHLLEQIRGDE